MIPRFTILKRDGFRCVYCGATPDVSQLHVDHYTPRSRGGTDHPSNLRTACAPCNLSKSATLPTWTACRPVVEDDGLPADMSPEDHAEARRLGLISLYCYPWSGMESLVPQGTPDARCSCL